MIPTRLAALESAIVKVGSGRGFIVDADEFMGRLVITAAHCLPELPPAHPFLYADERSYPNCLGPIGAAPTLWAECFFVDPIADVAVLGPLDSQASTDEAEAYEEFVTARAVLEVGVLPTDKVFLHTLDGRWETCESRRPGPFGCGQVLTLMGAQEGTAAGTSGSPIVNADGQAVGLVSVGHESLGEGGSLVIAQEQHGQPVLASALPLWLLSNLRVDIWLARGVCRQGTNELRRIRREVSAPSRTD